MAEKTLEQLEREATIAEAKCDAWRMACLIGKNNQGLEEERRQAIDARNAIYEEIRAHKRGPESANVLAKALAREIDLGDIKAVLRELQISQLRRLKSSLPETARRWERATGMLAPTWLRRKFDTSLDDVAAIAMVSQSEGQWHSFLFQGSYATSVEAMKACDERLLAQGYVLEGGVPSEEDE